MNIAVKRAFRILDYFYGEATEKALGVSQIGLILNIPKSSAYDLLETLSDIGYLLRTDNRQYRASDRGISLGFQALNTLNYQNILQNHMEELTKKTGFTTLSGILSGDNLLVTTKVSAYDKTPIVGSTGSTYPAHISALGKAILSTYPDDAVTDIIGPACYTAYTKNSITSRPQLLQNLQKIRKDGFAVENFEANDYIWGVASPIRYGTNRAMTSIGLFGFYHELCNADREALATLVSETARAIADEIFGKE